MYGPGYGYGMPVAPVAPVAPMAYGMPVAPVMPMAAPMMAPMGSVGVDVNGDGIPDYHVNQGVGVDVDGDGIADFRTAPTVTPGPGAFMPPGGYGYGYGY